MRISHLEQTGVGVYCKLCNASFAVPKCVLRDPLRLLEEKERIAARHVCGGVRAQRRHDREQRLTRPVCTESKIVSIDEHWDREIKRLFPVVGGAA